MKNSLRMRAFIFLIFVVGAGLLRFWAAPTLVMLPADYSSEIQLIVDNSFRISPDDDWQAYTLGVHRIDQIIKNTGEVAIIEGSMQAYFENGELNFETKGLYGVDRRTGANITGYGDTNRTGQYIFPRHVKKEEYVIWDPMFIGQRLASFEREEKIDGLPVYVFEFQASGMDETNGYSYLRIVPERYHVQTDGRGEIWVEPISGVVVDYNDSGVSYFINPDTGQRVDDFNLWEEQYTPATRTAQLHLAQSSRFRIQLLETWIPGLFLTVGLALAWMSCLLNKQNFEQVREDSA